MYFSVAGPDLMLFAVSFAVTFLPDVENQFVALMFCLGAAVSCITFISATALPRELAGTCTAASSLNSAI